MSTKHPNSRWKKPERGYEKSDLDRISRVYHEQPGWKNGARVRKRK